jgi:hypothetical protein
MKRSKMQRPVFTMPEPAAKTAVVTLMEKLSPAKLSLSPKMRWLIDSLTGQDNGARGPRGEAPQMLQITSDGFVQAGSMFIGSFDDLKDNLDGVLATVEASYSEQIAFWHLYQQHTMDWRVGVSQKAVR